MKVSGFTLCRNGVRLGFPFRESVRSLAPLCDEIVVALGEGEDNTGEELEKLAKELPCDLKFIHTQWDPNSIKGGSILAEQTNIALDNTQHEIVFYLQGDEVLHDEDYPIIRKDLQRLSEIKEAASIVFQWVHFFGDPNSYAQSRKWYRKEIRAFKKSSGLRSYKDAQSFRKQVGTEWTTLPAIESKARVLHYGWVRPADLMTIKTNEFQQWWGKKGKHQTNDIFQPQYGIYPYRGTHPEVMKNYLESLPKLEKSFYQMNRAPISLLTLRLWASGVVENLSGFRLGEFKSYSKILKN